MHASIANKDWTTFRRLVASDAWNIDDDGPMSIADFLKATQDPKFNLSYQYKTSDMKVVNASPTTKIVTYKLEQQGSLMGRPFPPTVYASTVWVRRGGTWQAVLHQESTPAPKK